MPPRRLRSVFEKRYEECPTYETLVHGIAELGEIKDALIEIPYQRREERGREPSPLYDSADKICGDILESDPPMYTDTLLRLWKIQLLCRNDTDPDIRPTCIAHEIVYLIRDLEASV